MSRIYLAFACFFLVLFRGRLPEDAVAYLPEGERPRELPEPEPEPKLARDPEKAAPEPKPAAEVKPVVVPRKPKVEDGELHREGALALLGLLQREGRLVDFLLESLDDYEDSDVGAAVREIHRGCRNFLQEHLAIEPVMPGDEDDAVTVPRGFDPGEVRLIGEVDGDPPFKGTLVHHGWRAVDIKLPALTEGVDRRVLAPAEVKLGS